MIRTVKRELCSLTSVSRVDIDDGFMTDIVNGDVAYVTRYGNLLPDSVRYLPRRWQIVRIRYEHAEEMAGSVLARTIIFLSGQAYFDVSSGDLVPVGKNVEFVYRLNDRKERLNSRTFIVANGRVIGEKNGYPSHFGVNAVGDCYSHNMNWSACRVLEKALELY